MAFASYYEDIIERANSGEPCKIIPRRLLNWGPKSFRPSPDRRLVYCRICKKSLLPPEWKAHANAHNREAEKGRRQHNNHAARRRWEHTRSERIALGNRMRVLERAGLVSRKLTVAEKAVLPSEMLKRVRALEAELMRKAQLMLLHDRQRLYILVHGPVSLASKQK
jgi:hypothetical protein